MSHPTREQVEKAVKLWRCVKSDVCTADSCAHKNDHTDTGYCEGVSECKRKAIHVACEIVGFRLPHPGCGSCTNWDLCDRSDDWRSVCDTCREEGYSRWTPRQPGKGD